jgi:flavin-dependent trigonelline monooxygenase, oxygenase component
MALKFWVTTPFFYPDMSRPWSEVLHDMLALVDAAEELGFEGVAINENQFQNYVTNPNSLMFSAVAAARTSRLKILPGVVVLPSYNPLLVASEMALLDQLAPGRTGMGVARGGSRYQLDRIGVEASKAREIYEESLEIIRRLWVEDDVSYDGEFYRFPPTTIVPKPVSQPGPDLWVASQSVDGVRKVAAEGLNLITAPNYGNFEPHGDLEVLLAAYNEAAEAGGKPRGEVMVYRHTWLGRTEDEALTYFDDVLNEYNHYLAFTKDNGGRTTREERLAARGTGEMRDFIVAGKVQAESETFPREGLFEKYADPVLTTPDRMIERFKAMEAIGVDHVACLIAVGQPIDEIVANMKLMVDEVFPAFAS